MKTTFKVSQRSDSKLVNKKQIKKMSLLFLLGITILGCSKPDSEVEEREPSPNKLELIAIRSTNAPTGNSCNVWDLQKSLSILTPVFSVLRTDNITSTANLLGQTTMTNQTSAYDKVNNKYAVSIGESVVIYDLTSGIAPVTYAFSPNVQAMEYVAGVLYVIHNNKIKILSSGVLGTPLAALPISGVSTGYHSNMTYDGVNIYFILQGKLYKFDTSSLTLFPGVSITGFLTGDDYNGVEYNSGAVYATKRHSTSFTAQDEFVKITLAGVESINLPLALAYTKDYSKISSALDYNTNTYYIISSNGHSSNQHTITTIDYSVASPVATATTTANNRYVFGLQIKD
jgi:hypothetical protein